MNATERFVSMRTRSVTKVHGVARSAYIRAIVFLMAFSVACLTLAINPAYGQADQAAITGIVSDPSGAAIPNAQVTLENTDTGLVLKATTDQSEIGRAHV